MKTISEKDGAIKRYHQAMVEYYAREVVHEQGLRPAFLNLLNECAPKGWLVVTEQRLANGRIPDGTLRDEFNLPRGYWEAKDQGDDLPTEIRKKIAAGYPIINTIFEDTHRAVLYQGGKMLMEVDLRLPRDVAALLTAFFNFTETTIADFNRAVEEFSGHIGELARGLMGRIQDEHKAHNPAFASAWANFFELCRASLDPQITSETVDEMLVQHLLTERLFRTVFDNQSFTQRNAIAAEIEKVITALTVRAFDRSEFLRSLDRFYYAIEAAARGLTDWQQKQLFMTTVYERFFQGFSAKKADTFGIVYTPPEIVGFMCASVEEVLRREFGTSLSAPGVQVLDPATGTGSFIVNLLGRISGASLEYKYANDLFANEIMLLPYYIAALNIEHEYYTRTGQYQAFDGLCSADTLELADRLAHQGLGSRSLWLSERNAERVEREQDAKIMVVIGNPPYNMGQENENDNNQNRKYPVIDARIHDTYARDSKATLRNKLSDVYVKFFRWATDRLQGRDGVVCLITNNSFVDQIAFDGMRTHLLQDFTRIYHLDLHGNVRKNPKLSGTTHNVFGIQVGVGITIAVRNGGSPGRDLFYFRVPEDWRKEDKLRFLFESASANAVDWRQLEPDASGIWLTEGMRPEFATFTALGTKEGKAARSGVADDVYSAFGLYSLGVATNRDDQVYSFDESQLLQRAMIFTEIYNAAVDRCKRLGADIEQLIDVSDPRIKWTRQVKASLARLDYSQFKPTRVRDALYRPFTRMKLYFDPFWNEEQYKQRQFFPIPEAEEENVALVVSDHGLRAPFSTLATNVIPDLHVLASSDGFQCFPYYVYNEDGSGRRENITDWALARFQEACGSEVTKRDIFHYVYGMMHHPAYRERYAENLKRELPRIPLVAGREAFAHVAKIGAKLAALHIGYEQAVEYPLRDVTAPNQHINWRVEKKMCLSPDRTALVYNDWLTLEGIPPEVFQYRLGNRSALDWVIDQYHVSTDARSGIVSDPNRAGDPQYIVRLIRKAITVSLETVQLVGELAVVPLPIPAEVTA
jgi:predicted helicase